jgi:hypothetical protein
LELTDGQRRLGGNILKWVQSLVISLVTLFFNLIFRWFFIVTGWVESYNICEPRLLFYSIHFVSKLFAVSFGMYLSALGKTRC